MEKQLEITKDLPALPSTLPSPTQTRFRPRQNIPRAEIPVFMGEFIGTFFFLFLAFAGTQLALNSASIIPLSDQSLSPELLKLLYIASSFGGGLAVNVAVFADISGAMFNPAVTLAVLLVGSIRWPRAVLSTIAQFLASMLASAVVSFLFPDPLTVTTAPGGGASLGQALLLETLLTFQLIIVILLLPASSAKPMYVGLTLFVAEMAGVYSTGGSLNPARSFGPAAIAGFQSSQWIYWLGPAMGAGLAAGVYTLLKGVGASRE